jgi:L-lactate utilization protein LutB
MDYNTIPSQETIQRTIAAIKERGVDVVLVENKQEALEKVKSLIPAGKTVMEGSSTTLRQIGFIDYLKSGTHPWKALHGQILKEEDEQRRAEMMREALLADYFLGSVNAIAQTGELVAADASGSRVGAYPYAAGKVILVSGVNKIVPTLEDAIRRVREYVYPLENERAKKAYGMSSVIGKMLIIEKEIFPERTTLVLVKKKLGF